MIEAGDKCKREVHGLHLIIVCDEAGIFDAFNLIKYRLSDIGNSFLSLIYIVSDKEARPLFEQELSILEKRFPDYIIVNIIRIDTTKYYFIQELIEATINSNTLPAIKFSVSGNAEFVNYVYGILRFLDVNAFMINANIT